MEAGGSRGPILKLGIPRNTLYSMRMGTGDNYKNIFIECFLVLQSLLPPQLLYNYCLSVEDLDTITGPLSISDN